MGYVSYDGGEKFIVKLESTEDKAALRAALKATPGADTGEAGAVADTLHFDHDNPSNVLAFWAAEFDWESRALRLALDQIAPIAWQYVAMHSGLLRGFKKKDREMFTGLADLAKKKLAE
jgi:hypothetical protein